MVMPSPGESIFELKLTKWMVENGGKVAKHEPILEAECDKFTLELCAETDGHIEILKDAGSTISVGDVVALIHEA